SNKLYRYLYFIVAISLPSILAGIRGLNVGTDYIEYIRHIKEVIAIIDSDLKFSDLDSNFEIGFNILLYIITRITDDLPLIVYLIYLFSAFFILKGSSNLIKPELVNWGYMIYLSIFWLFGFNGMRQGIATAICFYSLTYV